MLNLFVKKLIVCQKKTIKIFYMLKKALCFKLSLKSSIGHVSKYVLLFDKIRNPSMQIKKAREIFVNVQNKEISFNIHILHNLALHDKR